MEVNQPNVFNKKCHRSCLKKMCLNKLYTILLQKPTGPVDFASELAKKIGVAPVMKPPSPVAADSDDEEERIERKGELLLYSLEMSQCIKLQTMCYVRPAKPQISLCICAV